MRSIKLVFVEKNSKSKMLNPKQILFPKFQTSAKKLIWDFLFRTCLEFRDSNFGFRPKGFIRCYVILINFYK